nr:hypothetical protein [uncultured Roseobacter sp.]
MAAKRFDIAPVRVRTHDGRIKLTPVDTFQQVSKGADVGSDHELRVLVRHAPDQGGKLGACHVITHPYQAMGDTFSVAEDDHGAQPSNFRCGARYWDVACSKDPIFIQISKMKSRTAGQKRRSSRALPSC